MLSFENAIRFQGVAKWKWNMELEYGSGIWN
jgi:hypothetical protein